MRPTLCGHCRVEFRCVRNEHIVEVTCDGEPYQVWACDQYECPSCHASILTGWSRQPLADRGDPHYQAVVENAKNRGAYTEHAQ